jgi:hypothetical protein
MLVLKEFILNEDEDEFFIIIGRPSGFLSWILSLCGIDPTTSLTCNKHTVKYETSAIRYGKKTYNIPLVGVSCVSSGIRKPFPFLVLGIFFILYGILSLIGIPFFAFGTVSLIIGVVFLYFYKLNKTMQFNIFTGGDKPIASIQIKKSIIEGQSIDLAKYETAANLLNKAVLSAKGIKNGK